MAASMNDEDSYNAILAGEFHKLAPTLAMAEARPTTARSQVEESFSSGY